MSAPSFSLLLTSSPHTLTHTHTHTHIHRHTHTNTHRHTHTHTDTYTHTHTHTHTPNRGKSIKSIDIIHHIPCNVTFHNYSLYLFIKDLNYICGHVLPTIRFYHNDLLLYIIVRGWADKFCLHLNRK